MTAPLWHITQFRPLAKRGPGVRIAGHQNLAKRPVYETKGVCVHCLTYEESGRAPCSYSPCDGNHERQYP